MASSFKRTTTIVVAEPSSRQLPDLGSDHHAFKEMLVEWGDLAEDPAFRDVHLPPGWKLVKDGQGSWSVRDAAGFLKATVDYTPGTVARITPVRRFEYSFEKKDGKYRAVVTEWGEVIYRGKPVSRPVQAKSSGKQFLDKNYPGWESYSSPLNRQG